MEEGAGVGGAWVGGAGGDLRDVLLVFALPGCDCSASSSSISILVARSWFQHIKFVETKSKFEDFRCPICRISQHLDISRCERLVKKCAKRMVLEAVVGRLFVRGSIRFGTSRTRSLTRFVCTLAGWFGHMCIRSYDVVRLLISWWITRHTCVAVQFVDVWLQRDVDRRSK